MTYYLPKSTNRDTQKPRNNSMLLPPKIHDLLIWNYWVDWLRWCLTGLKSSAKGYNVEDCPTELSSRDLISSSTI